MCKALAEALNAVMPTHPASVRKCRRLIMDREKRMEVKSRSRKWYRSQYRWMFSAASSKARSYERNHPDSISCLPKPVCPRRAAAESGNAVAETQGSDTSSILFLLFSRPIYIFHSIILRSSSPQAWIFTASPDGFGEEDGSKESK